MRLPLRLLVALLTVDVVAFDLLVESARSGSCGLPAVLGAGMLALGAMAALAERTWGIGLVLAAASALATSAALGVGPSFFYVVAAIGALPFLFTMRPMARFHLGATVLFAVLASVAGAAGSVALVLLG
jgi:hypothetical protein